MLYYYIILSLRFTTVVAPLDLPTMRDGNDLYQLQDLTVQIFLTVIIVLLLGKLTTNDDS